MDEVGTKLRDARVAKNLSLEDIANTTKIPRSSLQSIEAGDYDALPAPVFVRGFIRAYARVVGADANALVRLYEASPAPEQHPSDGFRTSLGAPRAPQGVAGAQRPDGVSERPISRIERSLDPRRKLVPLQPVSERRDSGFRSGYTLLAVVAVGLLIAAWLLVGGKEPSDSAQGNRPIDRIVVDRVDGPLLGPAPRGEVQGAPPSMGNAGTTEPAATTVPERRQRRAAGEDEQRPQDPQRPQGPRRPQHATPGGGEPDASPRNR